MFLWDGIGINWKVMHGTLIIGKTNILIIIFKKSIIRTYTNIVNSSYENSRKLHVL